MRMTGFPSGSRRPAIQSSWASSRCTTWGWSENSPPRPVIEATAESICVDPVVQDGPGPKGLVFGLAQVEPHISAVEERHGLARHLEQELEAEDVPVPGDRPIDVARR